MNNPLLYSILSQCGISFKHPSLYQSLLDRPICRLFHIYCIYQVLLNNTYKLLGINLLDTITSIGTHKALNIRSKWTPAPIPYKVLNRICNSCGCPVLSVSAENPHTYTEPIYNGRYQVLQYHISPCPPTTIGIYSPNQTQISGSTGPFSIFHTFQGNRLCWNTHTQNNHCPAQTAGFQTMLDTPHNPVYWGKQQIWLDSPLHSLPTGIHCQITCHLVTVSNTVGSLAPPSTVRWTSFYSLPNANCKISGPTGQAFLLPYTRWQVIRPH